jgi:hypothetical protein
VKQDPLVIAISVLSIMLLAAQPITVSASQTHSAPLTCNESGSNSATSSDKTAYSEGSVTWNYCTNVNGATSDYEAYSGGNYQATGTIKICGNSESLNQADNFAYGVAVSSACDWFLAQSFSFNSEHNYGFPAETGRIDSNTTTWSGNCNNV